MAFNRQLYKQKPQIYGPVSSVQASIFKNAERAGIDPPIIYLPLWEGAGIPMDIMGLETFSLDATAPGYWVNGGYYSPNQAQLAPIRCDTTTKLNTLLTGATALTVVCDADLESDNFGPLPIYSFGTYSTHIEYQGNLNNFELFLNGTSSGTTTNTWIPTATLQTIFSYNGNSARVYVNNTLEINNTSVAASFNASAGNKIAIGGHHSSILIEQWGGRIKHFYMTLGSVTSAQAAFMHDNPYFLLHRVPPVFYSVPGGAITIKTITDTGLCLDSIAQISNVFAVADAGSGLDGFSGLIAGLSVGDVGEGSDSVTPAVRLTVQDTGAAIDFIQRILSGCSVTDTCAGADNIWQLLSAILVSDICGGADVISILKALLKTVTDSVTGTDTISQIFADILVSDSGAGTDFINLLKDILKTISDTGSGIENVSIQPVSVSVQDASTALDIIWYIAVALSVSDASTIAEIISTIKTKLVNVTDAGLGYDAEPTISVSVTVPDTSAALDIVRQVLNTLSISDSVYGFDRITKTDFDILPSGKVTVTFTIKTPGASFAMRTPKATFNIE